MWPEAGCRVNLNSASSPIGTTEGTPMIVVKPEWEQQIEFLGSYRAISSLFLCSITCLLLSSAIYASMVLLLQGLSLKVDYTGLLCQTLRAMWIVSANELWKKQRVTSERKLGQSHHVVLKVMTTKGRLLYEPGSQRKDDRQQSHRWPSVHMQQMRKQTSVFWVTSTGNIYYHSLT